MIRSCNICAVGFGFLHKSLQAHKLSLFCPGLIKELYLLPGYWKAPYGRNNLQMFLAFILHFPEVSKGFFPAYFQLKSLIHL